jgi:hypothetical protein
MPLRGEWSGEPSLLWASACVPWGHLVPHLPDTVLFSCANLPYGSRWVLRVRFDCQKDRHCSLQARPCI